MRVWCPLRNFQFAGDGGGSRLGEWTVIGHTPQENFWGNGPARAERGLAVWRFDPRMVCGEENRDKWYDRSWGLGGFWQRISPLTWNFYGHGASIHWRWIPSWALAFCHLAIIWSKQHVTPLKKVPPKYRNTSSQIQDYLLKSFNRLIFTCQGSKRSSCIPGQKKIVSDRPSESYPQRWFFCWQS